MENLKDALSKAVHDLNGPLCTININLRNLEKCLPELIRTYRKARETGMEGTSLDDKMLDILSTSLATGKERVAYCSSYLSKMSEDIIGKINEN